MSLYARVFSFWFDIAACVRQNSARLGSVYLQRCCSFLGLTFGVGEPHQPHRVRRTFSRVIRSTWMTHFRRYTATTLPSRPWWTVTQGYA